MLILMLMIMREAGCCAGDYKGMIIKHARLGNEKRRPAKIVIKVIITVVLGD